MDARDEYKVAPFLPEGAAGQWRVQRVTISPETARMQNAVHPSRRPTEDGTFTMLMHGGETVMIDTYAEVRDHREFLRKATGSVLMHGLGLGMAANACLRKPDVSRVTVVEKSADVIALVAPHLARIHGDRFEVIHADALAWAPKKGSVWDVAWHDVWSFIVPSNLPDMRVLHRRFGRRVGWQGSWCRWECEAMSRGRL